MSLTDADKEFIRKLINREINSAMGQAVSHIVGMMPKNLIYTITTAALGFLAAAAAMDIKNKDIPHLSYPMAELERLLVEGAGAFGIWTGGFMADYNRMYPSQSAGQLIIGLTNDQAATLIKALRARESSNRYWIINPYGYLGYYSMGAAALADIGWLDINAYNRASPAVKSGNNKAEHLGFLQTEANWTRYSYAKFMQDPQLQDQAFVELANLTLQRGFKSGALKRGDHQRLGGFIAAAHLGGYSAAKAYYGANIDSDDRNGVYVSEYAKLGENAIQGAPPADTSSKPHGLPMEERHYTRVSSGFGFRIINGNPGNHSGIDFAVPVGTPVKATADGKVTYAGDYGGACGYGVKIQHGADYATVFCHLSRIDVHANGWIRKGVTIGLSGGAAGAKGSGRSTGPHIHYAVKAKDKFVDPMLFLPQLAKNAGAFAVRPQQSIQAE